MNAPDQGKLNAYIRLLGLHRGEAKQAYDAVAERIFYGIPDVLGPQRARYAGKRRCVLCPGCGRQGGRPGQLRLRRS